MAHIALYRKYRPNTFESIVAQDHITKILKNQIQNNKIGHAYIFSGSRGTGKTTAAKVFARAVNCLSPIDGNPCNECENCLSIINGSTSDVIEMDAASNNSVDNIREIRQEVIYATTSLKYRVYIIDEAHMLTTSAFNALLKTLEEPPEGVIFILATTEQHKILPTIVSRCMRFEFKKIPEAKIVKTLENVLLKENKKYDEKSIRYIARAAEGGLRDALSILERCIDESEDVKFEEIQELVGAISADILKNIIVSIIEYNPVKILSYIEKVINDGKDIRQLANELLQEFMNLMIYLSTENQDSYTIFENDELLKLKESISFDRLNNIIYTLNELDNDIRMSTNPAIIFKAKLATLGMTVTKKSESKSPEVFVNNTYSSNEIINLRDDIDYIKGEIERIKTSASNIELKSDKSMSDEKIQRNFRPWNDIKEYIQSKHHILLYSVLDRTLAKVANNTVYLYTENEFSKDQLSKSENRELIIDAIEHITDKEFNLVINNVKYSEKENKDEIETILTENNIDYKEI